MNYRILIIFLLLLSCETTKKVEKKIEIQKIFSNKGFALLYSNDLNKNKKITRSLDQRSLTIFQKNLEEDSIVKITNLLNNKNLIAKVGPNSDYPTFYNAVISKRIFDELDLNKKQPYIEITTINNDSLFIVKKAKTFDEEKKVADKAPVEGITIKNLNKKIIKNDKKKIKKQFKYIIKIADFYFKDTADLMLKRIKSETQAKKINIMNISKNQYRLYLGPFKNLRSLKKAFNDISVIDFENLEIIKQ